MATKADGSVVIDTKMSTKGLTAGFGQIADACKTALTSLGKIEKELGTISSSELNAYIDAASASVRGFGATAENSVQRAGIALKKQKAAYDEQLRKVEDLRAQLENLANQKVASPDLLEIDKYIGGLERKLATVTNQKERFLATGGKERSSTFKRMEYDIDDLTNSIIAAKAERDDLIASGGGFLSPNASKITEKLTAEEAKLRLMNDSLNTSFGNLTRTVQGYGEKAAAAAVRTADNAKHTQSAEKSTNNLSKNLKKTNDNLKGGIGRILKYALGIRSLYIAFNKLREAVTDGIKNLAQFDSRTNASVSGLLSSLTQFKNSIAAAFSPIINVVSPILSAFIDKLSVATEKIGQFLAAMTGQKYVIKAKKVQEDYAASLADTASAAEEVQRNLSGLDQINVFETSDPTSAAKASTGVGADQMFETSAVAEGSTIFDKLKESMGGVLGRLNELKNKFAEGFKNGFGDTLDTFDRIRERAKNIAGTVSNIFTDPEVQDAQKKFEDSTAKLFGTVTGTAGKVGGAIGENLSTGVDRSLKKNEPRIKKHIIKMFDIGTDINNKLTEATSSVGDILSGVISSDAATGITENIVSIFTNIGMTVQSTLSGIFNDCLGMITRPITENKDQIEKNLTDFLQPIAGITESLDNLTAKASDGFTKLFDEHVHPCLESIQGGLSEIVGNMLTVWNEKVQPWLNKVGERIKGVIDGPVGNAVSQAQRLVGNLWDILHGLWSDFLKPFLSWVGEHFVSRIGSVLTFIGDHAANVIGTISGILGGIWRTLNGLIDFIRGTFTGDWKRAWNGIKDFFGGIWDAIAAAVKGPINAIIDAVNYVIRNIISGINSALDLLQFTAPDWVPGIGGKTVGFDIPDITPPQIPHLARGAVIPPNAPFTAVLGDQTKGYNIETPEALLRKIVREESSSTGGNTYRFVAQLDRRTIFDQTIREAKNRKIQTGGNPFELA